MASFVLFLVAALVWSQFLPSSALTEEEKLREVLSNPKKNSFQLTSNIRLTKNLPPVAVPAGTTRTLKITSRRGGGFSINGAKRYYGFWNAVSDGDIVDGRVSLTIDGVNLVNLRAKGNKDGSAEPGYVGFNGAAINIVKGYVTVTNSLLVGNVADFEGGAIRVRGGSLVVKNCNFTANVGRSGGALGFEMDGAGLIVEGCLFTGNKAAFTRLSEGDQSIGGAISLTTFNTPSSVPVRIKRTTFQGNSASVGGAFYGVFGDVKIPIVFESCAFLSNTVQGKFRFGSVPEAVGGAVAVRVAKELRFVSPTFKANTANGVLNNIYVIAESFFGQITTIRGLPAADAVYVAGDNLGNFVLA